MSALAESVTTRDAEPVDLDAVAALERAAFPIPWKRDYFAVEIGAAHRLNRVAIGPKGDLAGYVFCAFAAGELHVNKIAVSERHRRRGVASLLMDEVLALRVPDRRRGDLPRGPRLEPSRAGVLRGPRLPRNRPQEPAITWTGRTPSSWSGA